MKSRYHYIEVNPEGDVILNLFFMVGSSELLQIAKMNCRRSERQFISPSTHDALEFAYNASSLGHCPMKEISFKQFKNILS